MKRSQNRLPVLAGASLGLALVIALPGCGKPSAANIELRKENQTLRTQLAASHVEKDGLVKSIDAYQVSSATTRPALSAESLQGLFTAHDLSLGRLTGSADLDPSKPGNKGLKIYVVPTDEQGDALKAAGMFVVEAFDLSSPDQPRIGRWEFDAAQTRSAWHGQVLLYTYVLACPWQTPPSTSDLTIKIEFTDALTGRHLTKQTQVKVQPPSPTKPTGT